MSLKKYQSIKQAAKAFEIPEEQILMHPSRKDWLTTYNARLTYRREEVKGKFGHSEEHEIAFKCIDCGQWLRNASAIFEHRENENTCDNYRFFTKNLNRLVLNDERSFSLWANHAPSLSNAFEMYAQLNDPVLCPNCHYFFDAPIYLQAHLNEKHCFYFPLKKLEFFLQGSSLSLCHLYQYSQIVYGEHWRQMPKIDYKKRRAVAGFVFLTYGAIATDISKNNIIKIFHKMIQMHAKKNLPLNIKIKILRFLDMHLEV